MGRRERFVKGRLKSLNSVAINLIIKVVYTIIKILIRAPIRVSIKG